MTGVSAVAQTSIDDFIAFDEINLKFILQIPRQLKIIERDQITNFGPDCFYKKASDVGRADAVHKKMPCLLLARLFSAPAPYSGDNVSSASMVKDVSAIFISNPGRL